MADEDRDDQPGGGGEDRPNVGAWSAAGVLAVVVLLGAWVMWPRDDNETPDGGAVGSPSTTTELGETVGEGDCPTMPEDDEVPEAGPEVEWEIVYGAALPFSENHGPAVVDGDVARCFSHTPAGALIAATQIDSRVILARDGVEIARDQTAPGAGQDALIEALEERGWGPAQPGQLCQTAGFRFVTYNSDETVISIATRCPASGALQLTQATMRWVDGDWVAVLQDDGSFSATSSALTDLSGMVPWGGV